MCSKILVIKRYQDLDIEKYQDPAVEKYQDLEITHQDLAIQIFKILV
jgi:hypothetical protein